LNLRRQLDFKKKKKKTMVRGVALACLASLARAYIARAPMTMGVLNRLRPKKEVKLEPIVAGAKMPAVDVEDVGAGAALVEGDEDVLPSVPVSTEELFGSGKSVLFGLPGAFTPTCSDVHLPGFVELAPQFAAAGVSTIACTSENDRFVLSAWNATVGQCMGKANAAVKFLSDADGELASALGFREDMGFGVGVRTQRFALICEDGVVTHVAVDPGMNVCDATSAQSLLGVIAPELLPKKSNAANPAVAVGALLLVLGGLAAADYLHLIDIPGLSFSPSS